MKRLMLCLCLLALPVLFVAMAEDARSAMEGNPAKGASLYESCVPCHTLQGKGVAGLPVDTLVQKMAGYQTMKTDNPKIVGMQKALAPMSKQDILDLAAYITKM